MKCVDLFSFTDSWKNREFASVLEGHIKRSYLIRSIALLAFLPLDLICIVCALIGRRKHKKTTFFMTNKWPRLFAEKVPGKIFIGPIWWIFYSLRYGGSYYPASVIYILLGIIGWGSQKRRVFLNRVGPNIAKKILFLYLGDEAMLVHHSDALPYVRCFIKACEDLPIQTCCIQHGIFHEDALSDEVDGIFSDINIVRSIHDKNLLQSKGVLSKIYVNESFFICSLLREGNDRVPSKFTKGNILLIGEGLHIFSEKMANEYVETLKKIEADLSSAGYCVTYRPHPSEKFIYKKYKFLSAKFENLATALVECNAVIGYSSTLLVEAASIGVPAFQVKCLGEYKKGLERAGLDIKKYSFEKFSEALSSSAELKRNQTPLSRGTLFPDIGWD